MPPVPTASFGVRAVWCGSMTSHRCSRPRIHKRSCEDERLCGSVKCAVPLTAIAATICRCGAHLGIFLTYGPAALEIYFDIHTDQFRVAFAIVVDPGQYAQKNVMNEYS